MYESVKGVCTLDVLYANSNETCDYRSHNIKRASSLIFDILHFLSFLRENSNNYFVHGNVNYWLLFYLTYNEVGVFCLVH